MSNGPRGQKDSGDGASGIRMVVDLSNKIKSIQLRCRGGWRGAQPVITTLTTLLAMASVMMWLVTAMSAPMRNTSGRIHACECSSLPARFEVHVSPARPCTIITADPSLSSRSAAFLNICHDYIHTSGGTLRKRQGAQLAGHQQMRTMNNAHTLTFI